MIITYIGFPGTWEDNKDFIDTSIMLLQTTYGRIKKIRYEPIGSMNILKLYIQPIVKNL